MALDDEKVFNLVMRSTESALSRETISRESNFQSDLAFDSISFLTMALHIAEEFDLDISQDNEAYYLIQTIGDLIDFLNSKLG